MTRTLLAAAMVVASWNSAAAQESAPGACTGFVRGPDGMPLAGAEIVAFPRAPTDDVVGAEGLAPRPPARRTTTDAKGEFRLVLDAPATLLVRHTGGLGLAVPLAARHDVLRLLAQPLAEIALPDGATGAHVMLAGAGGDLALGFWPGAHLRVPGGTYRLLVEGEAGRVELHQRVRVGDQLAAKPATATPWRVRLPADADIAAVVVDGWRDVPFALGPDGELTLWPTTSPDAARVLDVATRGPRGAQRWQRLVVERDGDAPALQATEWRTLRAPGAVGIATLQARADGATRGLAWSPVEDGIALVPALDEAHFVAVRADGGILALGTDAPPAPIDIGRVSIAVRDAERPVAGAVVELDGPPPQVRRQARTDSRGIAHFAGVPRARGFARLVHDELCSDELDLTADSIGAGLQRLRARPGATLQGRIAFEGVPGAPFNAVAVTLRDPTGTDGLPTRGTPVGGDGAFAFRGLDADRRYTLFASLQHGGVTFSAKLHGVTTGAPVVLTLRSEDPLPPGHKR